MEARRFPSRFMNGRSDEHRIRAVKRRNADRALSLHRIKRVLADECRHVFEHAVDLRHELYHPRRRVQQLARASKELVVKELPRALEHSARGGNADVKPGCGQGKRLRAVENRKEAEELFRDRLLHG